MSVALEPGTTFAGYRIESVIGRGGMGVVYRATDLSLERPVALKLIAPELAADERFRDRFLREPRLAASLDHPNVLPIYEAGERDGQLYLAMRYVEGQRPEALLAREGRSRPSARSRSSRQVAGALDAAHRRGLVHRDVKPANVLLDEDGHAYLTDFGVTKQLGGATTDTGQLVGTLDYLAPEQIRGEPVDGRTRPVRARLRALRVPGGRAAVPARDGGARRCGRTCRRSRRRCAASSARPGARRALAKDKEERYDDVRRAVAAAAPALGPATPRRASRAADPARPACAGARSWPPACSRWPPDRRRPPRSPSPAATAKRRPPADRQRDRGDRRARPGGLSASFTVTPTRRPATWPWARARCGCSTPPGRAGGAARPQRPARECSTPSAPAASRATWPPVTAPSGSATATRRAAPRSALRTISRVDPRSLAVQDTGDPLPRAARRRRLQLQRRLPGDRDRRRSGVDDHAGRQGRGADRPRHGTDGGDRRRRGVVAGRRGRLALTGSRQRGQEDRPAHEPPLAETIPRRPSNLLKGVAVGAGSVWATSRGGPAVAHRAGAQAAADAHDRRGGRDGVRQPSATGRSGRRTGSKGTVSRVDPKTNAVVATVPGRCDAGAGRGRRLGVGQRGGGTARRLAARPSTCVQDRLGRPRPPDVLHRVRPAAPGSPTSASPRARSPRPSAPCSTDRGYKAGRLPQCRLPVLRRLHRPDGGFEQPQVRGQRQRLRHGRPGWSR